jgi:uncharacterized protein (TIGR03067 family)
MKKLLFAIALLSMTAAAIGKPAQNDVSAELRRLSGSWVLVGEIDDGKTMDVNVGKKNILTFDDAGNWKVEIDGTIVGQGTARIDPTRNPKTIDYTFTGKEGGQFIAIYELTANTYRHCGVSKGNRPSEFSSTPGSGQIITTFRREKN